MINLRVLVCGGRDLNNQEIVDSTLNKLDALQKITCLIHGGARGADSLSGIWAQSKNIETIVFPADWNRYGKSAGYIRNSQMLTEGIPDLVVAFPGGKGTKNMIELAKKANVPVLNHFDLS